MGMARFGLRNLMRGKVRLAVVVLLIGVPFFFLVLMQALSEAVEGYTEAMKRSVDTALQLRARGAMGHVNMVGSAALLPQDVLTKVARVPHVVKIEPYLLAMTPTEGDNFAIVVGVTPGDTKRLESHGEAGNPKIVAGRDLTDADRGQLVGVIGQRYARWAGITPERLDRATLTLDLRRTHPVILPLDRPARTVRIVGIYASGYVFGDMQLFIPLDTFRDVYSVRGGISWLFVRADSVDHVHAVQQDLRAVVGEAADVIAPENVATFTSFTTKAVVRLARWGALLAAGLVVVVVFFVTLLIVRERAWEIGTLKAIGAPTASIVLGFLSESVALCLSGAGLGLLLFGVLGRSVAPRLFALGAGPFLESAYRDTLFDSLSLPGIGLPGLGVLVAVAVLVAAAGSTYALAQVAHLSPVEAMRHE
jgi:ABC-type lipoprotein release transport system permease subunit